MSAAARRCDADTVLERHRKQGDHEEWEPAWVETGLVFTQEDGSWLHPGKVHRPLRTTRRRLRPPADPAARPPPGAATLMLAADIDIKIVSDILGHSDTRITRDIYQSVLPQVGKNAAEATAKLVPLQRKAEEEKAARKASKAAKKAKAKKKGTGSPKDRANLQARAKKKDQRKKPKK